MNLAYRERKRAGLVRPRPRTMTIDKAREVRRRLRNRENTQMELALEYCTSQSTIAKIWAGMIHAEIGT